MGRIGALARRHSGLPLNPHPPRDGRVHLVSLGCLPSAQVQRGMVLSAKPFPEEGGSLWPGSVLVGAGVTGPEEGACGASTQCQTPSGHTPSGTKVIPNCRLVFNFPRKIRLNVGVHKSRDRRLRLTKPWLAASRGCPGGRDLCMVLESLPTAIRGFRAASLCSRGSHTAHALPR